MTVIALQRSFTGTMTADEQRAWIERLMAHYRLNVTQLASRAAVNPSTLSKFVAKARPGHQLNTRTVAAIEKAFSVPFGQDPAEKSHNGRGFGESEATPFDISNPKADDPAVIAARAMCDGRNAADPWEMKGRSLEDVGILPGDILVVDLNEAPQEGDVVCVQHYAGRTTAETLFRIYSPPFFLAGAGPGARAPMVADGKAAQIRGVVIGTFRRRGVAASVA